MRKVTNIEPGNGWMWGLIICLLLGSCYSAKKAERQVDKAILEHPEVAAAELRKAFPCVQVGADTTIINGDTIVSVNCPGDYFTLHDTVINNVRSFDTIWTVKKVAVTIPAKTVYITKTVQDMADKAIIKDLWDKLSAMTVKNAVNKGKADMWFWIAVGLMAVIGVWFVMKIISIFK